MLATIPSVQSVPVLMNIVPVNVPALLGLDFLDDEELYEDISTTRLVHRNVLSRGGQKLRYEGF